MNVPAFSIWDESIHFSNDQQKRLLSAQKAETTPSTVDRELKSAEFAGSGKNPYHTTLESCTCGDFAKRRLPCKHIYRLAMECGVIDAEFKVGTNKNVALAGMLAFEEAAKAVERLNADAQIELKNFLYCYLYGGETIHSFKGVQYNDALRQCELLEEVDAPIGAYVERLRKEELVSVLTKIGIECEKKKKSELLDICVENQEKVKAQFDPIHSFALSPKVERVARKLYSYLLKKYEENECMTAELLPTYANKKIIDKLMRRGTVCLTGIPDKCSRSDFEILMSRAGILVSGAVSRKTSCLVVGEAPNQSNVDKAGQEGVPIFSFDEFMETVYNPYLEVKGRR